MLIQRSEFRGAARSPITRMKIHERLESKAVDIHIQKMASLTLNGHHYARPTNTRAQRGEGWRRASGKRLVARSPCTDRCRRLRGALSATLPLGMRREKSRYHFEPFRSRKGVTGL